MAVRVSLYLGLGGTFGERIDALFSLLGNTSNFLVMGLVTGGLGVALMRRFKAVKWRPPRTVPKAIGSALRRDTPGSCGKSMPPRSPFSTFGAFKDGDLKLRLPFALPFAAMLFAINPVFADCSGPSAFVEGGYSISFFGGSMRYHTSMVMLYEGNSPPYGRWVGVEQVQEQWSSMPMAPEIHAAIAATPDRNLSPVSAVCDTTSPDDQTVIVTCVGRYLFTLHQDNAFTWEGQNIEIGTYYPSFANNLPTIEIDLLAGAPGYDTQPVVDGNMTGSVQRAGPFDMQAIVGARTTGTSGGSIYTDIEIDLSFEPNRDGGTLIGHATSGLSIVHPGNTTDSLVVRLYGETSAARMTAATGVMLTGSLPDGPCPMTRNWQVSDLLLAAGVQP
ncbi:hypothetical protein A8B78_07450 [Jannaschia sp. EhC01]|nr:hypothetical protein A8B78_07450 [Jannaschia sp. EhC01]